MCLALSFQSPLPQLCSKRLEVLVHVGKVKSTSKENSLRWPYSNNAYRLRLSLPFLMTTSTVLLGMQLIVAYVCHKLLLITSTNTAIKFVVGKKKSLPIFN